MKDQKSAMVSADSSSTPSSSSSPLLTRNITLVDTDMQIESRQELAAGSTQKGADGADAGSKPGQEMAQVKTEIPGEKKTSTEGDVGATPNKEKQQQHKFTTINVNPLFAGLNGGARKGAKQWQEDTYFHLQLCGGGILVTAVFDGHGGYNGLLASTRAKETAIEYFQKKEREEEKERAEEKDKGRDNGGASDGSGGNSGAHDDADGDSDNDALTRASTDRGHGRWISNWGVSTWRVRLQELFAMMHSNIRDKFMSEVSTVNKYTSSSSTASARGGGGAGQASNRYVDGKGIVRFPNGDPVHGGTCTCMHTHAHIYRHTFIYTHIHAPYVFCLVRINPLAVSDDWCRPVHQPYND